MSKIAKPILLDETGKDIVNSLHVIANAIGKSEYHTLEQLATGIVLEESSNPKWSKLGGMNDIGAVIDKYNSIVIDPENKCYALLDRDNDLMFADGTPWPGTYGDAFRRFPDLHYLVKTDSNGKSVLWGSEYDLGGHCFKENFVGIYKGVVDGDDMMHSNVGGAATNSHTMSQYWQFAQNTCKDYGLMNYFDHQKMIAMMLLRFGNANCDVNVGIGLQSAGAGYYAGRTGATAGLGIRSGLKPYDASYNQVKLFGVEALWGQAWEFRPNIRFNGIDCIVYDGNIVSNIALGRTFHRDPGMNLGGNHISQMALGEYFDVIPIAGSGGSTTYWCDGAWSASGGQLLLVGANSGDGSLAGLSAALSYYGFSRAHSSVGARLAFKGNLKDYTLVSGAEMAAKHS